MNEKNEKSPEEKKAKSALQKAKGQIKAKVGELTDDERLKASGEAEEARGDANKKSVEARTEAKGKLDETVGKAQEKAGEWLDSETLRARGEARKLEGREQQMKNA